MRFLREKKIVATGLRAQSLGQLDIDFFLHESLDLEPAHQYVAAGFRQLALEECMYRFVWKTLGEAFGPGQLDDLRPEVERGDANVLRIIRERAQAKNIRAGSRRGAELRIGVSEESLLSAHPPTLQNGVAKLHFLSGFVVGLLAEKVSHCRRIFVQVDALSPTAVDVVHKALERPQTAQKAKTVIIREFAISRSLQHRIHRSDRGILLALATEFFRQGDSGLVRRSTHRRALSSAMNKV